MMDATKSGTEARVVVATSSLLKDSDRVPALFAVVADTLEEAISAVRDVAPAGFDISIMGGPLSSDTVERLALEPGTAKQIG